MAVGFKVADAYVSIHVDDDTRPGRQQVERETTGWADRLGLGLGRIFGRGITLGIGRGLVAALMGTAKLAALGLVAGVVSSAIAGLAGALINLLPYLHELVATAVSAYGVMLLLPGVIIAVKLATATAKLALDGFSDALKAAWTGNAEKFKEAMKALAPEARKVVREIKAMIPAFKQLKLDVQSTMFAGLSEHVRKLGLLYLPIVHRGLIAIAAVMNGAIKDAIEFFTDRTNALDISRVLGSTATTLDNLRRALGPLLSIIRDIVVVSTQVLAQLTGSGFLGALQTVADLIAEMRENGELAAIITDGVAALKQFVGLALDLLGILRGILNAAGGSGGLFAFFDRLNELINSPGVQRDLAAIFDALSDAATALTPVLVILLKALVPILEGMAEIAIAFAPGLTILVEALGDALASLVPGIVALSPLLAILGAALAPIAQVLVDLVVAATPGLVAFLGALVDGLRALVPVAPVVGAALGDILTALAPLLNILGPLLAFLLGELALAFSAVAKVIGPLVKLLAEGFGKFIEQITPVMLELAEEIMPVLAEAGIAIAEAFAPLIPVFAELTRIYVEELREHLPAVVAAFREFIPAAALATRVFSEAFVDAMIAIAPMLPEIVLALVDLARAMTAFLIAITPLLPIFAEALAAFVELGIETGFFQTVIGMLIVVLNNIVGVFKVVTAVVQFVLEPFRRARRAVESFGEAVSGAAKNALGVFRDMPGKIKNAVSGFGNLLYNAGKNIINGLLNGIRDRMPALAGLIEDAAGVVRSFWPFSPAKRGPLSGSGDLLYAGRNVAVRLADGMRSKLSDVSMAAQRLAAAAQFGAQPAFAGAPGGVGAMAGGAGQTGRGAGQFGPYRLEVDGRVLTEFVVDAVTGNPTAVAAATDEGRRERGFVSSPRARR